MESIPQFRFAGFDNLARWLRAPEKVYDRWQGRTTVCVAWLGLLLACLNPPHGTGITVCCFNLCTGLPCPGCGLTRSLSCGLRGMFLESWQYHPMGLPILAFFVFTVAFSLWPKRWRDRLSRRLKAHAVTFNACYLGFVFTFVSFGIARIIVHF